MKRLYIWLGITFGSLVGLLIGTQNHQSVFDCAYFAGAALAINWLSTKLIMGDTYKLVLAELKREHNLALRQLAVAPPDLLASYQARADELARAIADVEAHA